MNIYQIVYNSSAVTLKGSSGFGVRTASEGTPQAYIDLVDKNEYLRDPNSGKFKKPLSNVILEFPEKIHELPIGYYYRIEQINDKKIYLLGRVVAVCFDYKFYLDGKSTRWGNLVAHVLVSEEYPGKNAFNLLLESAEEGNLHFIPRDYTPVFSNTELQALMVGKPQPLPATTAAFPDHPAQWSEKALDLLFSYRAVLKEAKPIVVSLPHEITASTIAVFMSLLPENIAKKTTFVSNYQKEKCEKDIKITFVNEYYQYMEDLNQSTHINLMNSNRKVSKLEKIWRPMLEQALNANDYSKVGLLVSWIYSRIADDNMGAPAELNEALFNYSQAPELFTLHTIDEVDNILETLSKYTIKGTLNSQRLNDLMIQDVEVATTLADYANAIAYCEKASKAGLDVSAAMDAIKQKFTKYIINGDDTLLYDALELLKDNTLRKYTIAEKYRTLYELLPSVLAVHQEIKDEQQILTFVCFLESNAQERVQIYKRLLYQMPKDIEQYIRLFDADKEEAEKIDYLTDFQAFHNDDTFAPLFYQQVKREVVGSKKNILSKIIFDLIAVNPKFKALIQGDNIIFQTLYDSALLQLKPESYNAISEIIKTYVLPLLLPGSKLCKTWQLLDDVINVNIPNTRSEILDFYNLANNVKQIEALKVIAPLCLEYMKGESLNEFLCVVKQYTLITDKELINLIFKNETLRRSAKDYIICLAELYEYDYDQIYGLLYSCHKEDKKDTKKSGDTDIKNDEKETTKDKKNDEDKLTKKLVKKIIKENFPKLYSQHNKTLFWTKIKSLFIPKRKNNQ